MTMDSYKFALKFIYTHFSEHMKLTSLVFLFGIVNDVAAMVMVPELKKWEEHRYIQCVHCMDYNRNHISLFGCKPRRPISCNGNACFMRFHKELAKPDVMYTSGCLNLTISEMKTIASAQKRSTEAGNPNGTLLCELSEYTDTCVCANMDKCNFINLFPDFSEYNRTLLLRNVMINEINHMKMFLPHEYRRLSYRISQVQNLHIINFYWFPASVLFITYSFIILY